MMQDARETEYAWRLHEAGFSIFPVGSPALAGSRTGKPLVDYCKRPLVEWKRYQNTPPSDAMIAQWLQQYKGCNWGICTGRKVNVVDADSDQAVAKIEARDWITFSPFYVTTGNGRHYLYSTADGEAGVIKNSVGSATKIDTRGYGGFIVAPGSIHGTGVVYEFHAPEGKEIGDVFHDAPPLTMEDMRKIQTFHPDGENEKPSASNTGVDEGGRNNNLAAMAGKWIREDMPFHEVIGRAIALNDLNNPPLPENEVRRTVASVMQTHLMRPENDFVAVHKDQEEGSNLVKMADILALGMEPIPWVIKNHTISSGLHLTFGPPKQYKSFVAIDKMLSIATGLPFLGVHEVKKQGLVVYVVGEGIHGVSHRIMAWFKHRGIEGDDRLKVPFVRTSSSVPLSDEREAKRLADEIRAIEEELGEKVVSICIDTLARNFGDGDENVTKDMTAYIRNIDTHLREPFEAAVEIVHHTGHGNQERARGSIALFGAVDAQCSVTADENGVSYLPQFYKDAETPDGCLLKVKVVDLGYLDDDGKPVTNIVLEMTDGEPSQPGEKKKEKSTRLTPAETVLLQIMPKDEPRDFVLLRDDFLHIWLKNDQKRDNSSHRKHWQRAWQGLEKKERIDVQRDSSGNPANLRRLGLLERDTF